MTLMRTNKTPFHFCFLKTFLPFCIMFGDFCNSPSVVWHFLKDWTISLYLFVFKKYTSTSVSIFYVINVPSVFWIYVCIAKLQFAGSMVFSIEGLPCFFPCFIWVWLSYLFPAYIFTSSCTSYTNSPHAYLIIFFIRKSCKLLQFDNKI